jgi:hypothetical protein
MFDTHMLAANGEPITLLDEQTLASIVGGDGIKDWLAKQIGGLLFDCIADSLDTIIAAAKEGYEDAS